MPFKAIYHTVGFKEQEAKVFLASPITAKILEVERFTSAQDRFYVTTQRSINKVTHRMRVKPRRCARSHIGSFAAVIQAFRCR